MANLQEKLAKLEALLREMESVAVGFSGGVDSSFLSAAAYRALGDRAIAVTAYSATLPEREREEASLIAGRIGIRHILLPVSELDCPDFVANTKDRCYFCKKKRFAALSDWIGQAGFRWVLEGANADDLGDYRPGMRAIEELPLVRQPLLEIGFTKEEIRQGLKTWDIPVWDKLSEACLSSRVVYGQPITAEKLRQIELAETFIRRYCAGQVRVRHHGNLARIEVSPESLANLTRPGIADKIAGELTRLGFAFVALDLAGYRMGSLNALLKEDKST